MADRLFALAATVRVIHRVHGRATDSWSDAHMAFASGFTDLDKFKEFVADFADSSAAGSRIRLTSPDLRRTRIYFSSRKNLGAGSGGADQLAAPAG